MVLKDFTAGRVIKLHDGNDPVGMLGWILPDVHPVADAGKMTATVTISTMAPDRSGDVVDTPGISLVDHRRNPVVLFCHKQNLPIGMAEDRDTGAYTVRQLGPDKLIGVTNFDQKSRLAHQVFDGTYRKMLRGISIGFLPVLGAVEKSRHGGTRYKQTRLVEYSHLILPDHQDCLVEMVEKGLNDEPLCDPLMEYLRPLVPVRPAAVVSGFSSEVIAKAMNDTLNGAAAPDPMQPQPQQDPNQQQPQQDPNVVDHHAAVKDGIGTIMASVFEEFDAGRLDMKGFLSQMQKLAETHGHAKALGTGDSGAADMEDDDGAGEDADGPDADDLTDDDPEPDDIADEDPADFEPDPERPGKKKHVLAWTEKSVDASVGLWDFLTSDVARVADVAAPFAAVLKTTHAALQEGRAVNPDKLAAWITKAAARSGRAVDKLTGRRDAVLARAEADFGPVRKAIRTGLIRKAAPRPAEEIDDETADRIAAALLQTRTELYEATGK